jgi:transglutaminase-like putative cysteine protease
MMGELLTIGGEHFGDDRDESFVTIAGIPPTSSSYIEWRDDLIRIRVPEFGDSGLVRVHAGGKASNALLFSNRAAMPAPVSGADTGMEPRIAAISPKTGQIGSLITITGSGFGSSREGGGVYFSWDAEPTPASPAEERSPGMVEVFEDEAGYELWGEREIQVRVPDGAVSGNVEVRTARGSSRPVFFDVSGKPGTKTFRDKRSYTISYGVDIRVGNAAGPNTLYLWIPRPAASAAQRNTEILSRSTEPFVENYRGTTLFHLTNLSPITTAGVTLSYKVEVYTQETAIRPQSIKQESLSPMAALFTLPSALIPSGDERIKTAAAAITGRERNPYLNAQKIYEWLIRETKIQNTGRTGGAIEALEEKQADSYQASLLFCSLARAAGIPSIPVAGVLVNRSRSASRHYWAEFWIDGFGWVPLDPALGAGAVPEGFNLREDSRTWYFGNLDNQRIAFSRDLTNLSQMDPRGRLAVRDRSYALQNLWEEAVGGLESYSSLWGDITITGAYAE